ncbi:MAG: transcription antitermination factor NusB, partial [Pseudomonadales bacterium]|nr:transcription antitermination factor NusB [Pseudomonadales bacterium]
FINDHNMKRADLEYFREVIRGIGADEQALIELIESKSDRKFVELDPVEKGILLMSAFELRSRIDIPYRVVINEAIELAKSFGATDSYRFVNTVLDELSRELRKLEQHDSQ